MRPSIHWFAFSIAFAAAAGIGCSPPAHCADCADASDIVANDASTDSLDDVITHDAAADGDRDTGPSTDAGPADLQREIVLTTLSFDVTAHSGRATIQLAESTAPGVALEVGGLTITSVQDDATHAALSTMTDGALLHVSVPSTATTIDVEFGYLEHNPPDFSGASATYTLIWPYHCGNLFPCHSDPAQGGRFALSLTGVPAGLTAIYPPEIVANAPSYQVAWAIGDYQTLSLGTTTAGTHLAIHHFAADADRARNGTAHLVAAFDWYERTLGPYPFGSEAGTVEVDWPPGAIGGMEHHPLWHIAAPAIDDETVHFHEAAHGWFGDGVRIACWEDLVLSEGTVTYLAARATGEVLGADAETALWARYATYSGAFGLPAWPDSCREIDPESFFSNAPYIRGASFYRALEGRIGRATMDSVLRQFVTLHRGGAARMNDMLDLVRSMTGYDPTACAESWLRPSTASMRGPSVCP